MAIDHAHAFATGTTYAVTDWPASGGPVARARRRLARALLRLVERDRAALVSQSFSKNAVLGPGCRVGPGAWCFNPRPKSSIQLGASVVCRGILRVETFGHGTIAVGDHVYIGDDCIISCAQRVEIGRGTLLAHGVQVFDNDSHPTDALLREQDLLTILGERSGARPPLASASVSIGDRVWIGFNAIVLKGVRIGEASIVGAGSVVAADVPPYSVVAGNPARLVKQMGKGTDGLAEMVERG